MPFEPSTSSGSSRATSRDAERADGYREESKNRRIEGRKVTLRAGPDAGGRRLEGELRSRTQTLGSHMPLVFSISASPQPRAARSGHPPVLQTRYRRLDLLFLPFLLLVFKIRRRRAAQRDTLFFGSSIFRFFVFAVGACSSRACVVLNSLNWLDATTVSPSPS